MDKADLKLLSFLLTCKIGQEERYRARIKHEKEMGCNCISLKRDRNYKTNKAYDINLFPRENRMTLLIFDMDTDKVFKHVKINNAKKYHSK